jgi:type II secretion system protein J
MNTRVFASALKPQRSKRAAQLRRAFTLVEILIAMGILALVLAAIYSSWTAILRASKVGLDSAAAVQRARIAGRIIQETLSSAETFVQNQRYYAFFAENGSEPVLSFVTHLSPSFPRNGKFAGQDVRRVMFSVEHGELVLRQKPYLMDDMDEDEKKYPLVLGSNVKEFKTEFWDARLSDWIDEWKSTNQLPPMVRVTLKFGNNPYSTQVGAEVTRIVSIPAVGVGAGWQTPRSGPGVPGMPGTPGTPGGVPGNPAAPVNPVPGTPGAPGYSVTPANPGGPMFQPR